VRPGYATSVHLHVTFQGLGAPTTCAGTMVAFVDPRHRAVSLAYRPLHRPAAGHGMPGL
jgi:hypothetical protein